MNKADRIKAPNKRFLMLVLFSFIFLGFGSSSAQELYRQQKVADYPTGLLAWKTFLEQHYNLLIKYPTNWHLYTHTTQGRHLGFDPVLLTSFEVDFEEYGSDLIIPEDGIALLVAFEGNNLSDGQSLVEYVTSNLASVFYQFDGRIFQLGGKEYVELKGRTGTIMVTSRGHNVYSVFAFGANDPTQNSLIKAILAKLEPLQDDPIYIPPEAIGSTATSIGFHMIPQATKIYSFTVLPEDMLLPWAAGSRTYSGGPHTGVFDNTCTGLRILSEMSGVDFGMPSGTEVLAVSGGTIVLSGDVGGAVGQEVGIDHGNGFSTQYWHLSSRAVQVGDTVVRGQVIGMSGIAGTGAHLHLEFLNWPENTPYQAHGITIDGYTIRAYVRTSDGQGYNYQGTLTQGSETENIDSGYCPPSGEMRWWSGSSGTIVAGDGTAVWSTNQESSDTCTGGISASEIDDYLSCKGSPLAGHGATFVSAAQQWDVDPRLIVAIAGAESTFGLYLCASYNAWNWFYGGDCPSSPFSSWDEGINTVTQRIRELYFDTWNLYTIHDIGLTYCGSGCENWEPNVRTFYAEQGGNPDTSDLSYSGNGGSGNPCPQSGGVILYWNAIYDCGNDQGDLGYRQRLSTGWQNVNDGAFNDQASSIKIPVGWSAKLFEHADRDGASICFSSAVDDFGTQGNFTGTDTPVNDHVSSTGLYPFIERSTQYPAAH